MVVSICPLCKCENNEERFSERDYKLLLCNSCGLFFISPYPINDDEVHSSAQNYNYSYSKIEVTNPINHYLSEVQFYKKYFSFIDQECENAKSILDVGCGTGHLLARLGIHREICRVGIELNKARAKMARKIANCEIIEEPVENLAYEKKFDVIIMINVLSHIPSFDNLFYSICSLLEKNGKIILKVGEMKREIKKRDSFDWVIPGHLHFLGLDTIGFICSKYGFKINKHFRVPYSDELFTRERWKSPGRSVIRNFIKQIVIHIPFALSFLKVCYNKIFGTRIYSSFIVLSKQT